MDYEHQPPITSRSGSRRASSAPARCPREALRRYGAHDSKVRRYDGIKEDCLFGRLRADPGFRRRACVFVRHRER